MRENGFRCQFMTFSFQLCRLFIYLMAPNQDAKFKFFALQLTNLKRGSSIFLNMLLGGITTKVHCNELFVVMKISSYENDEL